MKNTIVIVIVIVVVVIGVFFFINNNKVEAPTDANTGGIGNSMPVPEEGNNVSDTEVVKEFTVSGKNFAFTPSTITVQKGDKVKITFINSQGFHDFRIDEFGVAASQKQSPNTEVLEFTADKVGSFEYYCSVGQHRSMGMKGIFKVE